MSKLLEYKYRLLDNQATWGIAIDLLIEVEELNSQTKQQINVIFSPTVFLTDEEKDLLIKGLKSVSKFGSVFENYTFNVKKVDFNDCDFQKEGLYFAAIKWCSEYFKFIPPEYKVSFDKENNRYLFSSF